MAAGSLTRLFKNKLSPQISFPLLTKIYRYDILISNFLDMSVSEVKTLTVHHDNSKVFMAFSDVTRLKILELLRSGEKSATTLTEKTGAGQSTLSHHMRILTDSGIVTSRKDRKWTFYSINEAGREYASKLLMHLTANTQHIDTIHDKKDYQTDIFNKKRRNGTLKPFAIVVDTSCDLTPEYIKKHEIEVMPIPFVLDAEEHNEGYWQKITGMDFYDALAGGSVAKTSQINPDAFVKTFTEYAKEGKDVIYIILSSALSATYQSSQIALAEVRETYPDCNIFTVDSISATVITTLLTMNAVEKRDEGFSAKETAAFLEEKKNYMFGVFTVDDLMYLHRGGRLSKLSAIGGSVLGIKPILSINPDGSLGLKEKSRGRDNSLKALINYMQRSVAPGSVIENVLIPHTNCEEDAQRLAKMVRESFEVRNIELILMCPVVGAHVGPGTVALVYESNISRGEFDKKYYS